MYDKLKNFLNEISEDIIKSELESYKPFSDDKEFNMNAYEGLTLVSLRVAKKVILEYHKYIESNYYLQKKPPSE